MASRAGPGWTGASILYKSALRKPNKRLIASGRFGESVSQTASISFQRQTAKSRILENTELKTLRKYGEKSKGWNESVLVPTNRQLNISTLSDAFACITELCNDHDYDHFMVANMPETGGHIVADDLILTNLPLYLVDDLIAANLLDDWSVLKELQHTSAPFSWSPMVGITSPISRIGALNDDVPETYSVADDMFVVELATTFAQCFQIATRGKRRVFIVLFSSSKTKRQLDPSILCSIQLIFDQIETLTVQRLRDTTLELNKREIECLNWAAAGKTSGEIAVIVSLSEHTVNHYLNSCCKKLDCVNRTQAVAKAVRLGAI